MNKVNQFRLICPNCKQEIQDCRTDKFVYHLKKHHLMWALTQYSSMIQRLEMLDWKEDKQDYKELVTDCLKEQLQKEEEEKTLKD